MMISPRLANAQHWRRLAVTAVVAVVASAALFARIRAEGDRAHEKLLQKHFPDGGFNQADEEKKRTVLRRGASREERERRVREDLERKRDFGSAKVLDE